MKPQLNKINLRNSNLLHLQQTVFCTLLICLFQNGKNEYNCTSNPAIVCPPLQCSEKEAIRKSEKDCCKVCPDRKNGRSQTSVMQGDRPEGG